MDLSKKKWLYVTGCSHTAGAEVITQGNGQLTHAGLQKSYTGLLAENYKLNLINDAYSGAGNEYIMRSAMDFVSTWQRAGRSLDDVLIICAWTTNERVQFVWEKADHPEERHIHWANNQDPNQHKEKFGHDFTNWFKALKIYATDYYYGTKRKVGNIVLTSNYLESNHVDYVMLNSCAKLDPSWHDAKVSRARNPLSRYDHYIDQLPKTYFEPYDSFIEQYWEKEEYKEHISDWLHADAHIHNLYYNKLKTWLETI